MRLMQYSARVAAAILVISAYAQGQVVPVQSGRQLDASHQIGSGGYNSVVAPSNSGFSSQLYVTGQVTGLSGFRGHVPYEATNQFQANAPSSAISGFTGRSVGVQDAMGGNTYRSSVYIDPDRATANVLQPKASLTTIGSPGARQVDNSTSYNSKLYMDAMAAYGPIVTSEYGGQGTALDAGRATAPDGSSLSHSSPSADLRSTANSTMISKPGASALFGVMNARDRMDLAGELYDLELSDDRTQVRSGLAGGVRPPDMTGRPGAVTEDENSKAGGTSVTPLGAAPKAKGMDVFTDVLVRMQEQRTGGLRPGMPANTSNAPENTSVKARPIYEAGVKPKNIFGDEMPAEMIKTVEVRDRNIVVHGLAGNSSDDFNVHMTRAEKKLKASRYYDAAGDYEIAITINPRNPLPHVGLALALTGAGEPLSAGVYLRRAMELFPPLMETRIDVNAMMDKDIVARRLESLKKRLDDKTQRNEPLLLLLEVFMARNSEQDGLVRRYLPRLQETAGTDRILSMYAEYISTGKKPQASSRPSSARPLAASAPGKVGK